LFVCEADRGEINRDQSGNREAFHLRLPVEFTCRNREGAWPL
jgi:hypothetical protein